MASGLQCPGCGHVHPAGLPEIARGDATFRCYGCYRTLSIPEGWSGRPTPRPMPSLTGDAPPGAGTRDARSARLAGKRGGRAGALTGPGAGAGAGAPGDLPTQMVPPVTADPGAYASSAPTTQWSGEAAGPAGTAGWTETRPAPPGPNGDRGAGRAAAAPLGWVAPAPAPADPALPAGLRAAVWAASFVVGLMIAAFVLRKAGLLDVDTVIDLYAGSGPSRFGILLALLPLWALLSATIAHFSLEALARRRRPRSAPGASSVTETTLAR